MSKLYNKVVKIVEDNYFYACNKCGRVTNDTYRETFDWKDDENSSPRLCSGCVADEWRKLKNPKKEKAKKK